jgi:hypothetical protein
MHRDTRTMLELEFMSYAFFSQDGSHGQWVG